MVFSCLWGPFPPPSRPRADVGPEAIRADDQVFGLRRQVGPGEIRSIRLDGQPVPGGGPDLVKFAMTFDAALRPGIEVKFRRESRICHTLLGRDRGSNTKYHGYGSYTVCQKFCLFCMGGSQTHLRCSLSIGRNFWQTL
jgi:hypothetical protein